MMHPTLDQLMSIALEAARAAGDHALNNRDRRREADGFGRHDVKLRLDKECQHEAVRVIRSYYPEHELLGEESLQEAAPGQPRWIIDPIDGTVNFYYGLPWWCCSIAVEIDNRIVVGVVYAPELNRVYRAQADGPSYCNERELHVSNTADLASSMVLTGVSQKLEEVPTTLVWFREAALQTRKLRVMGSAALDLCQVAEGVADGYLEASIYLWDVAAAGLILERAGGRIETLREFEQWRKQVMASNGVIHDPLKKLATACLNPAQQGVG